MTGTAALGQGDLAAAPVGEDLAPPAAPDRLWRYLFWALVAVSLPLLMFHFGSYHWFSGDEWRVLTDAGDGSFPDLLEPHAGAHWIGVPRLIYVGLWQGFGMRSYVPYQLVVVVMHLAVAVLLRMVMRRSGVRPVLATAAAAVFVLCGAGASNSIWAFQISFVGSIMWGLAHLLVADHDGPLGRRDLAGLALGMLALTSSGVGVTTTLAVGFALLLRRGWRPAIVHTVPLAAVYLWWLTITDAETTGPLGRPGPTVLIRWVRETLVGGFLGLGHFTIVAWLLVAVLVAGAVAMWRSRSEHDAAWRRARLAMPVGLALGALCFAVTSGFGRAWLGTGAARVDRYIYLQAALFLPLLAVAAEAVAERWRATTPLLVGLFLLPIPFNIASFGDRTPFAAPVMREHERVLTTAVRMPFARDVPADVSPIPQLFIEDATIGFLLDADTNGKLTPSTMPLSDEVTNEFRVRLGLADRPAVGRPTGCRQQPGPVNLVLARGDVIELDSPAFISTQQDGRPTSPAVPFRPRWTNGIQLTAELPDLHVQLTPFLRSSTLTVCDGRSGGTAAEAVAAP